MKSPHACKHIYGLIGYPLVHSFSRDFFNQKFMAENISIEYSFKVFFFFTEGSFLLKYLVI